MGQVTAQLITVNGEAQGTTYQVKYADTQGRNLKRGIDSLLAAIDKSLSTYDPESEISVLNRSHAIRFQSPYFYPVLRKSEEVYLRTGGLFDPTVMPLVSAYGFGPDGRQEVGQIDRDSVLQLVGFDKITFDSLSVSKRYEQVRLDFNAIAQGYSVDVIGAFLTEMGIRNYLVEVGGELRASGRKPDGSSWVVGIANPAFTGRLKATVALNDCGMATSGNYRNYYEKDGVRYNHIINPKTGLSEQGDLLSVTVFAPDAMTADAYATAFVVMGMAKMKELLPRLPELNVYAVYSENSGEIGTYMTDGISTLVREGAK